MLNVHIHTPAIVIPVGFRHEAEWITHTPWTLIRTDSLLRFQSQNSSPEATELRLSSKHTK
jgi:hypothetical protein